MLAASERTVDQVEQWHAFLDEAESILAGERLVPFWRGLRQAFGGQFIGFALWFN